MTEMLIDAAAIIAAAFCAYMLYARGLIALNCLRALYYKCAAPIGRHCSSWQAEFDRCSGMTRRSIHLVCGRAYLFTLSQNVVRGAVCINILGKGGRIIAQLDVDNPSDNIITEKCERLRISVRFIKAAGACALSWRAD